MAGKHRESSDGSSTVVKVAGLAGIAVAASLLSAGSAEASPLGNLFHKPTTSSSTPSTASTSSVTSKSLLGGRSFFTTPSNPTTGFGQFIVKTNPVLTTGGIPYITTNSGTTVVTGLCLNRRGC